MKNKNLNSSTKGQEKHDVLSIEELGNVKGGFNLGDLPPWILVPPPPPPVPGGGSLPTDMP